MNAKLTIVVIMALCGLISAAAVENKACTCGKILGSHCGGRANIPYEYGLYALTGDCIPTGYYNCPAIDRAPEFKGICNTCQQSEATGKDSCHGTFSVLP